MLLLAAVVITGCLSFLAGALFFYWLTSSSSVEEPERTTYWADGLLRQDDERGF